LSFDKDPTFIKDFVRDKHRTFTLGLLVSCLDIYMCVGILHCVSEYLSLLTKANSKLELNCKLGLHGVHLDMDEGRSYIDLLYVLLNLI
jgi:hypothetical protein